MSTATRWTSPQHSHRKPIESTPFRHMDNFVHSPRTTALSTRLRTPWLRRVDSSGLPSSQNHPAHPHRANQPLCASLCFFVLPLWQLPPPEPYPVQPCSNGAYPALSTIAESDGGFFLLALRSPAQRDEGVPIFLSHPQQSLPCGILFHGALTRSTTLAASIYLKITSVPCGGS